MLINAQAGVPVNGLNENPMHSGLCVECLNFGKLLHIDKSATNKKRNGFELFFN